jgi:hypothetical protein
MATQAQYASVPKVGIATISTANTNRDGTGTIGTVFSAGSNGSRIDAIDIQAIATTTAGMIRLFIHDGTTAHLINEVPVLAITPSGTVPAWAAQLNTNTMTQILPIILPTGYSLRAATNNAESFKVIAFGGDF